VNSLAAALARGAKIRILTTDYLGVTEPDALEQLIKLPGDIDVRLYSEPRRSYHQKHIFSNIQTIIMGLLLLAHLIFLGQLSKMGRVEL